MCVCVSVSVRLCVCVCVCVCRFYWVFFNCLKSNIQYRSDFQYNFVSVFHFAVMIGVTCTFFNVNCPYLYSHLCVKVLYNVCMF